MINGEKSLDPAVAAAFNQWVDTAPQMPVLIPTSAKTSGENLTSPNKAL